MNEIRIHVLTNLKQKLSDKKSENVEKSIYNFAIQYASIHHIPKTWDDRIFIHVYNVKVCEILQNLTQEMVEKLENKTISAQTLAFAQESNIQEELIQNEVQDGIFQCWKCSSKKTTYYSLQTRSADEPMTNFITCVNCKHRWKM